MQKPRRQHCPRRTNQMTMRHDEPKFSEMFVSYLLARNTRVEEDLVDQPFNSTEKRLARVPLLMANFGKDTKPEPVIAKISQETFAEMIGTTLPRVNLFMNKFRQLGFLEYNGHSFTGAIFSKVYCFRQALSSHRCYAS